jgi:molybdopterin-containing oxidoreductase family membrane subunit
MFFEVRWTGPFAPIFWLMVFCNIVVPQIFWFKKFRTNLVIAWVASLLINIGMWCERFNIVVTSLHRDFLPASWGTYAPTWVDITLFTGTIGLFSTLFLLFLKFVPAVAVQEIKELRHETEHEGHDDGHGHSPLAGATHAGGTH